MPRSASRFNALDAWRGICAVLVAMFHLQTYSHVYDVSLIRHSYLFVDFFFVLSGFVITASYRQRLLAGFSFWKFMLLRFGRLYPLHFFILAALVAVELVRYQFNGLLGGGAEAKFVGPHSVKAILTNLLLIQSFDIHKMLTWNLPAWSISVEFYTYFVFGAALLFLRRWIYAFVAVVFVVAPFLLFNLVGNIDTDYDYGIIRCVYGFFIGFAVFDLYQFVIGKEIKRISFTAGTLMEVCCLCFVLWFVCLYGSGPATLFAPSIFGLAVLIFSLEAGCMSQLLRIAPFLLLGRISYSIYMVHSSVIIMMSYLFRVSERAFGLTLTTHGYFGAHKWQGDLCYGVLLCLVVGVSCLTYLTIEAPGRSLFRRWSNRLFAPFEIKIAVPSVGCHHTTGAVDSGVISTSSNEKPLQSE